VWLYFGFVRVKTFSHIRLASRGRTNIAKAPKKLSTWLLTSQSCHIWVRSVYTDIPHFTKSQSSFRSTCPHHCNLLLPIDKLRHKKILCFQLPKDPLKPPSLRFLLDHSKISVSYFVCFHLPKHNCLHLVCYAAVFLLTLVLMGTMQCITLLFYELFCDILHGMPWNKKKNFKNYPLSLLFRSLQLEAQEFF